MKAKINFLIIFSLFLMIVSVNAIPTWNQAKDNSFVRLIKIDPLLASYPNTSYANSQSAKIMATGNSRYTNSLFELRNHYRLPYIYSHRFGGYGIGRSEINPRSLSLDSSPNQESSESNLPIPKTSKNEQHLVCSRIPNECKVI